MDYRMVWVKGHVEVYDSQGNFFCSADSMWEAQQELEEIA